jgi:hypothetical protein
VLGSFLLKVASTSDGLGSLSPGSCQFAELRFAERRSAKTV